MEYKVGDRITMIKGVNSVYINQSGIIRDSELKERWVFKAKKTGQFMSYLIEFPDIHTKPKHWFFPHWFEIDKPLMRELRLDKLLNS
jgi:hypothetical protein